MTRALGVVGVATAVMCGAVLVLARIFASHWNLILILGMIALPLRLLALALDVRSKRIRWPQAWTPAERPAKLAEALVQTLGVAAGAAAILAAIVPAQLGDDLASVKAVVAGLAVSWVAMAWLPRDTPRWGLSALMLFAALLFGFDLIQTLRTPAPGTAPLQSPLAEPGLVIHGGASMLTNHHAMLQQQRDALDIVVLRDGKFIDGPPGDVESYGCWGVAVTAPAAGRVVRALDGLDDNQIGQTDIENLVGNNVVLEIADGQYALFAHLQSGSVAVAVDETVEAGQTLGKCGNSGNTSAPHLHFQVMDSPDFSNADTALHTVAAQFSSVDRGGAVDARVPRRNDTLVR